VIDPAVSARFPGYAAAVVVASGVPNGPPDAAGDALLRAAEASLRARGLEKAADDPHIAAWRAAFSAFGAKPSRFPSSAEALASRVLKGGELPRVNRLVDVYNAVSVTHLVPIGGEDADKVAGTPRLVIADGTEPFDGPDGPPKPGEVVWRDDEAVTCRRWNWRQGRRTALTEHTTRALFILDALAPASVEPALAELTAHLEAGWPGCTLERLH
jgi:DNA/RNA-binding domain of Phe-tRNA-synthetase-like protein